jgi:hypothetical protein
LDTPWALFSHPGSSHRLPPPCEMHNPVLPLAFFPQPGSSHWRPAGVAVGSTGSAAAATGGAGDAGGEAGGAGEAGSLTLASFPSLLLEDINFLPVKAGRSAATRAGVGQKCGNAMAKYSIRNQKSRSGLFPVLSGQNSLNWRNMPNRIQDEHLSALTPSHRPTFVLTYNPPHLSTKPQLLHPLLPAC